jgi:small-conductance mechanosensitive channel
MEFNLIAIIQILVVMLIVFVIYFVAVSFSKRALLKKAKTKKMKHNVIIFFNLLTYLFVIIFFLSIVLYFSGGSLGIGLAAGLLSAALGWALQRPITGIAAWIMVVATKPFGIGDRIIIGSVKGDVANITLTHIHLSEFGGTIGGEETSGRYVIIPNAVLFEQNVINYTSLDEYILDEVAFSITYGSDLNVAKKVSIQSAKKILNQAFDKIYKEPFIRINFQPSGIDVRVRYYTIASERQKINSEISEEIFKNITKEKKAEFAFPHTKIIFDENNLGKKLKEN